MTYAAPILSVKPLQDEPPANAAMRTPAVRLRSIRKSFGAHVAVDDVSLDIFAGDFVAILGPSGCGKTTLLRLLGGFLHPDQGTIAIDDRDVTGDGPERRPTNTVFQGYGLFPHMSVRQNVGYGLKISRRLSSVEIRDQVNATLTLVRMGEFADRNIRELSGGQQQRVALARALVMRPRVLLLDESLAALDLKLRQQMQDELRRIHREIGGTFVFVTHDQNEAFCLANKVAVMNKGRIEQFAAPSGIYHTPQTRFVATFVGEANMLDCRRQNGIIAIGNGQAFPNPGRNGDVQVMVRPENVRVGDAGPRRGAATMKLRATLIDQVFQGSFLKLTFADENGRPFIATLSDDTHRAALSLGDILDLAWDVGKTMAFDQEAGPE